MGKVIIIKRNNRLFLSLFENNRLDLLETASLPGQENILGNIYLAKVKDVVSGINGAFLSISNDNTAYLSFAGCKEFLTANRMLKEGELPKQGDEVVVQITGEALKKKPPSATARLTLTGQYCVCSYYGHGIHYSKKLNEEKKQQIDHDLRSEIIQGRKKYQFTIRTNAGDLKNLGPLFSEMRSFIQVFDTLTDTYQHRTCYSCLYHTEPEMIRQIRNLPVNAYEEIVTDEPEIYEILTEGFENHMIRFYQDERLSLSKLYSMDTHFQEALGKKVWLPCGGYLVIEPTEAMVVIDVNSGKAESRGKKSQDYYLKINMEAAKEIARQLRIRNYSGMIMIDFINMESEEDNQKLLKSLDGYLKEDKVRTRLIDMTALGIVEITRKKVSRPLADFFKKDATLMQK